MSMTSEGVRSEGHDHGFRAGGGGPSGRALGAAGLEAVAQVQAQLAESATPQGATYNTQSARRFFLPEAL